MKILAMVALLLLGLVTMNAAAGEKSLRHFVLKYQDSDFVVPKGEQWELTWKSPYKPGDIFPAYDVRIKGGVMVEMNRHPSFQVAAFNSAGDASLDISAGRGKVSIRLPSGTEFAIANDLLCIEVTVSKAVE